jgi:hypothetical protein
MSIQTKDNSYAFLPSSGGGSRPSSGGGATGKTLVNPSPQDLGKFAKEIASGELKVSYE